MYGIVERVVKRRRRLNEAAWAELLERFGTARLSVEEFCRREGVCRSSFNRWRTRLQPGATTLPAPMQPPGEKRASSFVDLGVLGADSGGATGGVELRIELGRGVTLLLARR